MYVSKAEVTAVVAVGELLMVEAELMQDGGMEVVHVHLALHGVVAVFVGVTMGKAWFNAASGQPGRETVRIMVSSGTLILRVGCASEFATPPYDGIIQ